MRGFQSHSPLPRWVLIIKSATECGDGLTQRLWSYNLYRGKPEPWQPPVFHRQQYLLLTLGFRAWGCNNNQ